mgnify:CR=1 FL=1
MTRPTGVGRLSTLDLDAAERLAAKATLVSVNEGDLYGGMFLTHAEAVYRRVMEHGGYNDSGADRDVLALLQWVGTFIAEVRSLRSMLRTQRDQQEELNDETTITRLTARAESAEARIRDLEAKVAAGDALARALDALWEEATDRGRVCRDDECHHIIGISNPTTELIVAARAAYRNALARVEPEPYGCYICGRDHIKERLDIHCKPLVRVEEVK